MGLMEPARVKTPHSSPGGHQRQKLVACQCYDHLFSFLLFHSLGSANLGALWDHSVIPSNGAANEVKQGWVGGGAGGHTK